HHFAGPMRARKRGGLLLVGSMSAFAGNPGFICYGAAKAYLRVFCEGLWYELKPHGVHVLCHVLSATATPRMVRKGPSVASRPMDDSDGVAQEGLDHLPHGPVYVVKSAAANVPYIASGPRAEVVTSFAASAKALNPK